MSRSATNAMTELSVHAVASTQPLGRGEVEHEESSIAQDWVEPAVGGEVQVGHTAADEGMGGARSYRRSAAHTRRAK